MNGVLVNGSHAGIWSFYCNLIEARISKLSPSEIQDIFDFEDAAIQIWLNQHDSKAPADYAFSFNDFLNAKIAKDGQTLIIGDDNDELVFITADIITLAARK